MLQQTSVCLGLVQFPLRALARWGYPVAVSTHCGPWLGREGRHLDHLPERLFVYHLLPGVLLPYDGRVLAEQQRHLSSVNANVPRCDLVSDGESRAIKGCGEG